MFSQDDDSAQRTALGIVFALVALVVASVIGFAAVRSAGKSGAPAAPAVPVLEVSQPAAVAPDANAGQTNPDAASVVIENGVVKFYFASGKSDLADGAKEAMVDVLQAAKAGRVLVLSGFHDETGDPEKNAALARQRAEAVRDALRAEGVADTQMELKKPESMTGEGSNAQARRVEISLK